MMIEKAPVSDFETGVPFGILVSYEREGSYRS